MNPPRTLIESFDAVASRHPQRVAVYHGDDKLTYEMIQQASQRYAGRLQAAYAVQPGDRVGILLKNRPEFINALYAILRCGGVVVPVNTFLKAPEIQHIIDDCQLKCLVSSPDFNETVERLDRTRIIDLADLETVTADRTGETASRELSDTAVIIYTSGTTGRSKGAVLTHGNLASNVQSCIQALEQRPSDRMTLLLPMFHSFMLTVCILTPLSMGASVVLIRSVQPFKLALKEIMRRRATIFVGIPQIFQALAQAKIPFYVHWLLNLRLAVSGSAPLPAETLTMFDRKFRFPLLEGYGLSEASPVVSFNPIRGTRKAGSVGLPLPDISVRVVDDAGQTCPCGEVGEILVRGPNVMKEYFNQPEESARALQQGWLYTGDMGRLDEDGYIYIVDRRKEMLLVRGQNVYPREIEEVLYQLPGVAAAAVVARADEKRGEVPVAFLCGTEAAVLEENQVLAHCRDQLADYKVPREIRIIDEMPRNATGKIAKLELKKMV